MTRLTDLSTELLELILSHLHEPTTFNTEEIEYVEHRKSSKLAFRSLALTCRSLGGIATKHLYHTISFRIWYPEIDLFCRTLQEADRERSCRLKSYVRVAVFWRHWCDDSYLTPDSKYAELINALSNVRNLQLRNYLMNMWRRPAQLEFLDPTSFPRLRRLYLNCVVDLFELRRIVNSTPVETLRVSQVEERLLSPQKLSKKTRLQTLQIDSELAASLMNQLLVSIGGCKRLITWTRDTPHSLLTPKQELSRREFVASLNSVKDVLEHLELRYNDLVEWNAGDTSVLYLRDFSALKTLKVNARCLFTECCMEENRDISAWFPPSLEQLEVYFDTMENPVRSNVSIFSGECDYQWLINIARNKHKYYPRLRHLYVWQLLGQEDWGCASWPKPEWKLPVEDFVLAEIHLTALTRDNEAECFKD